MTSLAPLNTDYFKGENFGFNGSIKLAKRVFSVVGVWGLGIIFFDYASFLKYLITDSEKPA
jgi:hypothetical protein